MTGPGRSPSSPWVQSAQGRASQPFHPGLSPSQTSMQSSAERPSPNYFGITVENSSNPFQCSLPSPKMQLYSQESVSEGLSNLLRSESDVDKGRRESALQSFSTNGDAQGNRTWSRTSHSSPTSGPFNNRILGSPSGYAIKPAQIPRASSRGESPFNKLH
jgi:protein-tyrosine phosphatase